jgi:Na+/citrate or Na+/malate symporter
MDTITESLRSPFWWFSVVFVSLVVTIVAAYLKQAVDRKLAKYSKSRASKIAADNSARQQRVERIRRSDRELVIAIRREQIMRMWTVVFYVLAALLFVLPLPHPLFRIGANFLALILMILGIYSLRNAQLLSNEIDEGTHDT